MGGDPTRIDLVFVVQDETVRPGVPPDPQTDVGAERKRSFDRARHHVGLLKAKTHRVDPVPSASCCRATSDNPSRASKLC